MLRIELLSKSKLFGIPSVHAFGLHTNIVTFLIEKIKLVSFSMFLDAPPPPKPRCPLDIDMPLNTHTAYVKGVLGLGGERGCISKRRHQTSDKNGPRRKIVVLFVHQL